MQAAKWVHSNIKQNTLRNLRKIKNSRTTKREMNPSKTFIILINRSILMIRINRKIRNIFTISPAEEGGSINSKGNEVKKSIKNQPLKYRLIMSFWSRTKLNWSHRSKYAVRSVTRMSVNRIRSTDNERMPVNRLISSEMLKAKVTGTSMHV